MAPATRAEAAAAAAVAADPPLRVPAPLSHALLAALFAAPLLTAVPPSLNIVATASAAVLAGCWRSAKPAPPEEAMTKKDAMRFPLVGSALLLSLFLAFKFLPKDLVNLVLSAYFVLIGTLGLVACFAPLLAPAVPRRLGATPFAARLPALPLPGLREGLELDATPLELALFLPAAAFCAWYWSARHWAANNALGLAFSLQGVEHLSLGSAQNGVILLAGLFVYDVFWVFCTPVMVSVARSFDAPIKLLFPRVDPLTLKPEFSMLGLGDIVIPGVFVALALRYDLAHRAPGAPPRLFRAAFAGYVAGLGGTIAVMNIFKAAQPALLYIVPAVLGATFGAAALSGEARAFFLWEEAPETAVEAAEEKGAETAAEIVAAGTPAKAVAAAKAPAVAAPTPPTTRRAAKKDA